jgi:transposase
MRAHSLDLRTRIVTAYERKEGSMRELAKRFSVSKSSVYELLQLYRTTGSVEPIPYQAGAKAKFDDTELVELAKLVAAKNDATLSELCEQMYERTGIRVSEPTMCRTLQRQGMTRKKNFLRQ